MPQRTQERNLWEWPCSTIRHGAWGYLKYNGKNLYTGNRRCPQFTSMCRHVISSISMNRTKLCSNEAVKLAVSLPSLFSLCGKGIPQWPIDVRLIVDRCKNLQIMEMSHSTNERDNECCLLASECDVSLFFTKRVFKTCCKLLCNSIIESFYMY